MRIVITGIQGQDGSILAEKHLENGDEVWGTASFPSLSSSASYDLLRAPLESPEESSKILDEIKPDRIYHLAAKHRASTNHESLNIDMRSKMYDCHVKITQNILEWQISNSYCKSLIALSSQMYTPNAQSHIINEESKCNPQNYYAATKFEAMKLLQTYRMNYNLKTYGAILFNHTSTRSRPDFLFPYLAKEIVNLIEGTSTEISLSDPNGMIDICHADEVCDGLYNLLFYDNACDVVFSSGKLVRIADLITNTLKILNFKGDYTVSKSNNRRISQEPLMGDPSFAARIINWKVKLNPEDILLEQVLRMVKI